MRNFMYKAGKLGYLTPIVKDRFFLTETIYVYARLIKQIAEEQGKVSVNEVRDKLNFGRKLTVQLMEYFDRMGFYVAKVIAIFYAIRMFLIYDLKRKKYEKTLVAALISSVILLTGCQDKDTEAKIKQLNQTVAQLSAENTKLKDQIEKQSQQFCRK